MTLQHIIERLLSEEHLLCATAIDEFGHCLFRIGPFQSFPAPSLVSALLGPLGDPRSTYSSLEGQLLPQVWSQGSAFAFADRPVPGVAVILFGTPRSSLRRFLSERSASQRARALYDHSQRVGRRIREELSRES